jgi:hypothetical protein
MPAEMYKNYPVGRRESHAYEISATAQSGGIPRHNASAFGGGRMSIFIRNDPSYPRHQPSIATIDFPGRVKIGQYENYSYR